MNVGENILLGQFYRELKLVDGKTFIQPCFWVNNSKPITEVEEKSEVKFSIYKARVIHTNDNPRKMVVTTARMVLEDDTLSTEGFVNYNYIIAPSSAVYNQLANLEWVPATFTKTGTYQFNFNSDVYYDIKKLEAVNKLLGNRLDEKEMAILMSDISLHLLKLHY